MKKLFLLLLPLLLWSCGEDFNPTLEPAEDEKTGQGNYYDTIRTIYNGDTVYDIQEIIYKLDTAVGRTNIINASGVDSLYVNGYKLSKLTYVENFTSCCDDCGVFTLSYFWDEYITPTNRIRHKIVDAYERSTSFTSQKVIKIHYRLDATNHFLNQHANILVQEWLAYGEEDIIFTHYTSN